LSSVLAEPGADDGKSVQNSLTQYTIDSRGDGEVERCENLYSDEVLYYDNLARSEGGGDDIGSDAPASVSLIQDVFVEYERTFSMPRRKKGAAHSGSA
jgi:hypothetical protein